MCLVETFTGGDMIGDKGIDAALALELQAMFEQLKGIDLSKLDEEIEMRKTKIEKLTEDLELGKKWERRLHKKRPRGRPKLHWKTREANLKRRKKKYYENVLKPRRARELAEELRTVEGWYKHITRLWKGERMTFEQWEQELWPKLEGRIPVFKRDDTKKGWTLDNVSMYESGTGVLISSSEDYRLKKLGYTL